RIAPASAPGASSNEYSMPPGRPVTRASIPGQTPRYTTSRYAADGPCACETLVRYVTAPPVGDSPSTVPDAPPTNDSHSDRRRPGSTIRTSFDVKKIGRPPPTELNLAAASVWPVFATNAGASAPNDAGAPGPR